MTRRRLLNGAAVLAALQLALAGAILWRAGAPGVFGGDFIAYDGAARQIAARGWAGLYDLAVQVQYQGGLLAASGLPASRPTAIPFNYPPPAALLVLPFAGLPARLAVVLWAALNCVLALAAAHWSLRAGAPNGGRLWPLAALLFLPLDWGLLAGQPVGVMLLLSAATLLGLLRRQDALAGGSLALLAAIKPQLVIAPALGLLVLRRGRAVAAALAVGLALLALSLLLVGIDGLRAYVRLLTTMDGFSGNAALAVQAEAMTNWRAWLLRVPGLGVTAGFWLAVALDGLTLLAALVPLARQRSANSPDAARTLAFGWLTLTAAGILASYHSHYQDLALLLPPALVLASEGRAIVLRRGEEAEPPLRLSKAPAPPILGDLTRAEGPWRHRPDAPARRRPRIGLLCWHGRSPFVRSPSIGGAGACSRTSRALLLATLGAGARAAGWERPRAISGCADAVAALALACLGLPCLAWLLGGVLAFAALPLWAALAAIGLAALTGLPLLLARLGGDGAQPIQAKQAATDGACAPARTGVEA